MARFMILCSKEDKEDKIYKVMLKCSKIFGVFTLSFLLLFQVSLASAELVMPEITLDPEGAEMSPTRPDRVKDRSALPICGPAQLQDQDVRVVPYVEPVKIDHTQKSTDLRKIAGRNRGSVTRFPVNVGLTTTNFLYRTELSMENLTYPDGRSCVGIEKLVLKIQSRDNIVYIARSIPQGSCLYREVMLHEQKHVTVNDTTQAHAQDVMKQVINDLADTYNGQIFPTAEQGYQEIERAVNDKLRIVWAGLNADWAQQQADIDSPQEYERLSGVCNNGISYLFRYGGLK